MKKIFILILVMATVLTGCLVSPNTDTNTNSNSGILQKNLNSENVESLKPLSRGTYKTSETILIYNRAKDIDDINYVKNVYIFGGFSDYNTFVLNIVQDKKSTYNFNSVFYYNFEIGTTFNVPYTDFVLKVVDFNLKDNSITFEQLK